VTSRGRPRDSSQALASLASMRLCRLRNLLLVLTGVVALGEVSVDGHVLRLKDVSVHWGWAERRGRPPTRGISSTG